MDFYQPVYVDNFIAYSHRFMYKLSLRETFNSSHIWPSMSLTYHVINNQLTWLTILKVNIILTKVWRLIIVGISLALRTFLFFIFS